MSESNAPRPGHVTLAGWMVVLGSVATIVAAWEQIATLHTVDTRDRVRDMLTGPLAGSGAGMSEVIGVLHGLALVAGACGAAAAVLGWFAMQRSRSARVALSVIAVPLLFTGMSGSGFFSTIAAAAVVLLWLPPSRDWYDGVQPAAQPQHPAFAPPATEQPAQQPQPHRPAPYAAPMSAQQPPAWSGPWTPQQAAQPQAQQARRPTAVTVAGILTWLASALFSASTLLAAVTTTADPGVLESTMKKEQSLLGGAAQTTQVSSDFLVLALWLVTVVVVLLAVTASVFAVFAWRRQEWARIALLICSGIAAAFFLVSTLSSPATFLFFAAAAAVFAFLLRPETRAWFARR